MSTEKFTISAFGRKNKNDENLTFPIARAISKSNAKPPFNQPNFSMAVRELIIEWDDYQTEVCGYLYCRGIGDPTDPIRFMQNQAYKKAGGGWIHTAVDEATKQNINSKQLLCFVKPPGRKTSFIRISKDEMHFYTLNMNNLEFCERALPGRAHFPVHYPDGHREFDINIQIRSLFDEKEVLPIKNAQVTVELHVIR